MGLINHDLFVGWNGVQKADTYLSFNNEPIQLHKGAGSLYSVRANCRIFWDKDSKDGGKSFLELRAVSATLTAEELSTNLYSCLYAELKKTFPNSEDSDVPPLTDPVVPSQ